MNKTELTKYPEDEEFVNRILESRKRRNKEKPEPEKENDIPWMEGASLPIDGGVMLQTSEILDFAEGVDSD